MRDEGVEYREIKGFEGYCAGSDGSIWSCLNQGGHEPRITNKWRKLSPGIDDAGYHRLSLYIYGIKYPFSLHTLVITAFKGPPPTPNSQCRHLDGNPRNNKIDNLEWGTCEENAADKEKHGRHAHGEDSVVSKLKEYEVIEIKKKIKQGKKQSHIAEEYNVSPTTIAHIRVGKTWVHIKI